MKSKIKTIPVGIDTNRRLEMDISSGMSDYSLSIFYKEILKSSTEILFIKELFIDKPMMVTIRFYYPLNDAEFFKNHLFDFAVFKSWVHIVNNKFSTKMINLLHYMITTPEIEVDSKQFYLISKSFKNLKLEKIKNTEVTDTDEEKFEEILKIIKMINDKRDYFIYKHLKFKQNKILFLKYYIDPMADKFKIIKYLKQFTDLPRLENILKLKVISDM